MFITFFVVEKKNVNICNFSIVAKKKTSASVSAKPKLSVLSAEKLYICAAQSPPPRRLNFALFGILIDNILKT